MRATLTFALIGLYLAAAPALAATQLTGAGSTFDYPFFSKAFYDYAKTRGDVQVNYQSIGSGGGIAQFTQRTVDFGATDVPMSAAEIKAARAAGGPVLQVPVALGGVSIVYNLPGVRDGLRLSPSVLSGIFIGSVANWNDRQIARLNPGVTLPNLPIVVVHRADGSGTTYIFTDYLSSVSPQWKNKVGTGKSVAWIARSAIGGKGSEGVAGQVDNNPGSIGYVELAYAQQNHMTQAVLENAAGKFVSDSAAGVRIAASTKSNLSAQNFSIVNMKCAGCYPIAGYSWVVVYRRPQDASRAKPLQQVLTWLTGPAAQKTAGDLGYVPLPENVQALARKTLATMRV